MERPTPLRIGAWRVDPASSEISRDGETARLDARAMRLFLCLAERAGEVVSIDELLDQVWSGVSVSPDSVYQAVTSLRRQLGDDPKHPTYIATVPRLGYRMVAAVGPRPVEPPARWGRLRIGSAWTSGAVLLLALLTAFLFFGKAASSNHPAAPAVAREPSKTIAVLPFLDLTDQMSHEIFADGMTEELIDKFSKIPGLEVTPPTSSFYYKGKQVAVADISKNLGVAYVVDGSVRKAGTRLRVAARLIRADTGYVVWSETYDRPWVDLLLVQDDIAGEVAKALRTSIGSR